MMEIHRTTSTLLTATLLTLVAAALLVLLPSQASAQGDEQTLVGTNMRVSGIPDTAEAGSQVSFDLSYFGPMPAASDASVEVNGVMVTAGRETLGSEAIDLGEFGTVLVEIGRTEFNTWTVTLQLPEALPEGGVPASLSTAQVPGGFLYVLEFLFWMGGGFAVPYQGHVTKFHQLSVFRSGTAPPPGSMTATAPHGLSRLPTGYLPVLGAHPFPATVIFWQLANNAWTFLQPAIEKGRMLREDAQTFVNNAAQTVHSFLVRPATTSSSPPTTPDPTNVPVVSTRDHFTDPAIDEPSLTSGHTATDYTSTFNPTGWPEELVIYVHGFANDEAGAKDAFSTARTALRSNGYQHPVVGFSWDSDTGVGDFDDAAAIATLNGAKLAQFVIDQQMEHPEMKVRIIGHSLGTRVILNALRALDTNEKWAQMGAKVRSVHVVGAAVDNEEVDSNNFGPEIGRQTDEFHNLHSTEDDVLENGYPLVQGDNALGENGADFSDGTKPANYTETDVTNELTDDTDGNGSSDWTNGVGDNHSGYNGVVNASGTLTDDGAMDVVVRQWTAQEAKP